MIDPIEELVSKIQSRDDIMKVKFTPAALNSVAEVFERDGFGATRLYLLDKQQREKGSDQEQATAFLAVLALMRDCSSIEQRRPLGRLLIKSLGSLRTDAQSSTTGAHSGTPPTLPRESAYPSTPRGQSRHQNPPKGPRR